MSPGVYSAKKKNGKIYFRSNITYHSKHISLGSFLSEQAASDAYKEANLLLYDNTISLNQAFAKCNTLNYEKIVILINFRDNHIYLSNPIILQKNYFVYYLSPTEEYKFDIDDLFYYTTHKILRRGNSLYVNDYGMQYRILDKYGIHSHSVPGRDYKFVNGDPTDLRYSNIRVINPYYGVINSGDEINPIYNAKIHINGNISLGTYDSAELAAIAYNKACDIAKDCGFIKDYPQNFISSISPQKYADIYTSINLPKNFLNYVKYKDFK